MAADVTVPVDVYKLRAGAPMPVGGANFVLQTFMAEKSETITYLYTENLPGSDEFRGQLGDKISASFTRLLDSSGDAYSGKEQYNPTFIEEF